MQNFISLIIFIFLSFLHVNNINAQCGATSVTATPQPSMICEGNSELVSFTATGTCLGSYEYEVLDGATVVQAWSTTTSFNASPVVSTNYTVNVRCSACPAIIASNTFLIDVIETPIIAGNLVVCNGGSTVLTASGSTGNFEWWDSASGGTQLSATGTYTTPALASTTTYYVNAAGTTVSGGSILITECGLAGFQGQSDADYIEVSNLYTTPVNTTGWVVAISSSYSNINAVNSILWSLPNSFNACSVVSRNDVSGQPNYWGNNIMWNPGPQNTYRSWAMIVDNLGNIIDFVAWGWTAANLATLNTTINGFPVTLGSEWTGNGCASQCGTVGGTPAMSIQRVGIADNNDLGDFVCQVSTPDVVNPGLSCGWTAGVNCPFPVTVTVDPIPTATVPSNAAYCDGDPVPASVFASTPAGGTFTWSNSNNAIGLSSTGNGDTPAFTAANNTGTPITATITVTPTVNGCLGTPIDYTITVNPIPAAPTVSNVTICPNNNATLTATAPGGTYEWYDAPSAGTLLATGSSYNTPALTSNTTYYVQTTLNGCLSPMTPVTVTIASNISSSVVSVNLLCYGVCIGEINITGQGGTPPYQYSIDNGLSFQSNASFTGLCTGVYDIIVMDDNGCFSLGQNVQITEPPLLTMTLGVTNETCFGYCDGMINSIPNGGTGPGTYTYNWTPASGNVPLINGLCVGSYSLTVTDNNGCYITENTVINGPTALIIDNIVGTDEICGGDCLGTITVYATGATLYSLDGITYQASNVFSNLCTANYVVYVQDANTCVVSQTFTINGPTPVILQVNSDTTICIGGTAQLNAIAAGGVGGFTYSWDNGPTTQSISVSPVSNQIYCVIVTDQNGCPSAQECITVSVNPALSVQAFSNQLICDGDIAAISASASGGDGGPYTYSWDQGLGIGQNQTVSPTSTTFYTVTATDGCETPSATASITITVSPVPTISFIADTLEGCIPLTVTFTENNVPAGSQYIWSFGDGGVSYNSGPVSYPYMNPGCWDVSLDIITPDGCNANHTQSQYICVFDNPTAAFTFGPQPTTILNSGINFTNNSNGGSVYTWDFGGLSQSNTFDAYFTFPDTGVYAVELLVISNDGCADSITHPIIISPDLLIYVPNAVTPDGDGLNDVFLPSVMGHIASSYELLIFDRWGNLLFESQHPDIGWDCIFNGRLVKSDVYVWKVVLKSEETKLKKEFIGHVTVLK